MVTIDENTGSVKERKAFEEQQLALGGYDTGAGNIHQQSRINREQAKNTEKKRNNEQSLLLLSQQFSQDLERVGDKIHDAQVRIYEAIMQTQDQIKQAE